MRTTFSLAGAALAVLAATLLRPATLAAQDNYEIQVYGSELVPPGHTMLELHSNYTFIGDDEVAEGLFPEQGAEHETIEITHGFTDWFETGFYIFTSIQPGFHWWWVGDHIRPRFAIPKSWHWPVGLSISNEIGYQRRQFSPDTWTWQINPIVDKQMGRFYWSFNPILNRSFHGESVSQGVVFSPAFTATYDVTPLVNVGLEYYGSLGPVTGFDPLAEQEQQIFPVINLNWAPQWEFNAGVGWGLTQSSDRLIAKMILGYRFDF